MACRNAHLGQHISRYDVNSYPLPKSVSQHVKEVKDNKGCGESDTKGCGEAHPLR